MAVFGEESLPTIIAPYAGINRIRCTSL